MAGSILFLSPSSHKKPKASSSHQSQKLEGGGSLEAVRRWICEVFFPVFASFFKGKRFRSPTIRLLPPLSAETKTSTPKPNTHKASEPTPSKPADTSSWVQNTPPEPREADVEPHQVDFR
ncbi:hypothetical protein V8G54_016966 [Vigna mungo]|uniref:Uncharacterized protein n=1 Tax=Vigna mungo TaxID=3915 RepID=A0AAQ3S1N7_VIGMU